jgi:hypothetical protein
VRHPLGTARDAAGLTINPFRQLERDEPVEMSPEMRALADRALQRMEERRDEDIEQWAERLARDVADAKD